jgi:hypothetical protein
MEGKICRRHIISLKRAKRFFTVFVHVLAFGKFFVQHFTPSPKALESGMKWEK